MRIFKSKWFAKFARKAGVSDAALKAAVSEIEAGCFDADLGGYVYKQRVARVGQGKRGGYRTIVLLKRGVRAFFVYGFAKKDLGNIGDDDLAKLKESAKDFMKATDEQLQRRLVDGSLAEVT
jgi:hypothetical protein